MLKVMPPDHPADLVREIVEIIRSSGLRTVHYPGGADEGLLRAIIGHRPPLEVSVMDMPDRWGTGYAFFYEEREVGNCLPRELPDWLEGIPFYQEVALVPVFPPATRDGLPRISGASGDESRWPAPRRLAPRSIQSGLTRR